MVKTKLLMGIIIILELIIELLLKYFKIIS